MSTNSLWFWQQNRKEEPVRESVQWKQHEPNYIHSVELVHQREISCSNGHRTHYMTIKEIRDTYGYKMPGRITCEKCGKIYMLTNPVLED